MQRLLARVDGRLERGNLSGGDAKRRFVRIVLFGAAEIGADIEEIVLDYGQEVADLRLIDMEKRNADTGVGLVEAAERLDADVAFRNARSIAERSQAGIPATGVNAIDSAASELSLTRMVAGNAMDDFTLA